MTELTVKTTSGSYKVAAGRGIIDSLSGIWRLDRRVAVITDDGVPAEYAKCVAAQCADAHIVTLPQGEATKCVKALECLWEVFIDRGLTRRDAVVAVGGGVVGDLAGFAAATYMRGIDFYNVPTTVLSQVDSSVGGKTAIDLCGLKNPVGAFYPPRGVILDPSVLSTLSARHVANGLAEAIKMAATLDPELFAFMEENSLEDNLGEIILRAVKLKIDVVERDEREAGLRRVLNFGHTAAHALESASRFKDLFHGEAVSIGMIPMAQGEARERLKKLLEKAHLPTAFPCGVSSLTDAMRRDKKASGDEITCVICPEIGKYKFVVMTADELEAHLAKAVTE
ncbi:MAG: 3-dehydroquinate synthase [Clostridia bacterium]|nr:3-dehydroquinate synthase [Clostridia bacterium]